MTPELREAINRDPYDALPESIRCVYSREQWLWLTDSQKADLNRLEMEPEWDE